MIEPGNVESMAPQVLIVDAHQEMLNEIVDVLTATLPDSMPACTTAQSGQEALERTKQQDFHVALLEVHLPDGSGLELLRGLRELRPLVQIVVITGDASVETAIRALHEGAVGYVLKPFEAQQLTETAHNAIARSRWLREREALTRRLEASERRHRELLEQVPALILALDGAGRIAVWNQQLEKATGFSAQERLGTDGTALIGDGDVTRLARKGGGHCWVRWKRTIVPSPDGETELQYAAGIDVTEERETHVRTMRSERLAAVGTLASGLAHEVRNPLNSATLQLQLLERKAAQGPLDSASLGRAIDVVKSELERLDSLVDDFLAFADPKPITTRLSDLNELVQSMVDDLENEATSAQVRLKTELSPNLERSFLDERSVRQAVVNLVRNAIEATGADGTVLIKTTPSPDGASIRLSVVDDGPGFAEDAPVFDAFYTTKDTGTGLGLSIVHRIVGEHGGKISVTSEPGRTVFEMELPLS